jgi:hypothetical protein
MDNNILEYWPISINFNLSTGTTASPSKDGGMLRVVSQPFVCRAAYWAKL